jgi:hypothetical protein
MRIQKQIGAIGTMLSFALVSTVARAEVNGNGWKNIGPILSDDVAAFVDFQIEKTNPGVNAWRGGPASYQYSAKPLWVNVHRNDLSPNDKVFVQIISYEQRCYRGECFTGSQTIVERNLDFANAGHFTGELGSLTLDYQLNDGYAMSSKTSQRQELVIWINDRVYKDPQGHNLQFNMRGGN